MYQKQIETNMTNKPSNFWLYLAAVITSIGFCMCTVGWLDVVKEYINICDDSEYINDLKNLTNQFEQLQSNILLVKKDNSQLRLNISTLEEHNSQLQSSNSQLQNTNEKLGKENTKLIKNSDAIEIQQLRSLMFVNYIIKRDVNEICLVFCCFWCFFFHTCIIPIYTERNYKNNCKKNKIRVRHVSKTI